LTTEKAVQSDVLPVRRGPVARSWLMTAIGLGTVCLFWPSLNAIMTLALHDDRYLQVLIAPVACALLMFVRRAEIFSRAQYSPRIGIPLLAVALCLALGTIYQYSGKNGTGLFLAVFAITLAWMSAFVLCYGFQSFRAGIYPLSCLFLMIPPFPSWMDLVARALQQGSAAVSYQLLRFSGIPVLRRGMQFSLPGFDFEVAPECSGIRSGIALIMVGVVVGYLYLHSGWARAVLLILTVPIVVFKNALRIVVLAVLGAYVNRIFVDGPLHHTYGGLVFSIVGITLFGLALAGLLKLEGKLLRCKSGRP
jgi:exosortase